MCYHYLLIVTEDLVTPNMINDLMVNLATINPSGVRIAFIVVGMAAFVLSNSSEMIVDTTRKEFFQKHRYQFLGAFLICVAGLLYVESFTLIMFKLGYPLFTVGFLMTGFILRAIFTKEKRTLNDDFGFKKCFELDPSPDNFYWTDGEQYVNIKSHVQHTQLIGGPGAGKSWTWIEPFIEQAVQKGYAMMIFDFKMNGNFSDDPKYFALTHYAYRSLIKYSTPSKRDKDGKWIGGHSVKNDRRKLYIINFRDPRFSHRCNPIHPMYINTEADAYEAAITLLQNMKKEWVKQKDFFADNAILLFKGIIWWARNEYDGRFCTIPHCLEIALRPERRVLQMLSMNEDAKRIVQPIMQALDTAPQQLAGVFSTLQSAIQRVSDPQINWVLSGNDFSLKLNDPENPGILCFGSDPELPAAYGPMAALIAKQATKMMNQPGRLKSLIVLDELPQIAIPGLDTTLATCRSNGMGFVLAAQDISQFYQLYNEHEAESTLANCLNAIAGQTMNEKTKKAYSEMIGTRDKLQMSTNNGKNMGDSLSRSSGSSESLQEKPLVPPYKFGVFKTGEFVGKVAVISDGVSYDNFFHIRPKVNKVGVQAKFPQILNDPQGNPYPNDTDVTAIFGNFRKVSDTNTNQIEIRDPAFAVYYKNNDLIRNDIGTTITNRNLSVVRDRPETEIATFPTHYVTTNPQKPPVKVVDIDAFQNVYPLFEGLKGYDFVEGRVIGVPDLDKPLPASKIKAFENGGGNA
jgi:hypothetical protein